MKSDGNRGKSRKLGWGSSFPDRHARSIDPPAARGRAGKTARGGGRGIGNVQSSIVGSRGGKRSDGRRLGEKGQRPCGDGPRVEKGGSMLRWKPNGRARARARATSRANNPRGHRPAATLYRIIVRGDASGETYPGNFPPEVSVESYGGKFRPGNFVWKAFPRGFHFTEMSGENLSSSCVGSFG